MLSVAESPRALRAPERKRDERREPSESADV